MAKPKYSNNKASSARATRTELPVMLKKIRIDDLLTFSPITANQEVVFTSYREGNPLLLHGYAGTGKTFMSLYLALEEVLDASSDFKKVVVVRSTVETRKIGHLPGTEQEKISVFELPYVSICSELFNTSDAYAALKNQGTVEFISTSFIRGTTIADSVIIVDEMQNLNFHELDSIITRPGANCKVILCGDYTQSDLVNHAEKQGIKDFMKIIEAINTFDTVELGIDDIVRSSFVRDYIIKKHELGL